MTAPCLPGLFSVVTTAKPNAVTVERKRLNAAAYRVLQALKAAGEHGLTNVELCQPHMGGLRAIGGRCHELRQQGWVIEKRHEHGGVWRYTLKGLR